MLKLMPDAEILRDLGREITEIAALDVHDERRELWRRLNCRAAPRPLVWINEVPWHEMGDELVSRCTDDFLRSVETELRQIVFQWRHFPADMIVDPYVYCAPVIRDTGFGIQTACTASAAAHGAVDFVPVIRDEADLEKIGIPDVVFDRAATARNFARLTEIFDGVVPVKMRGLGNIWHCPMDTLARWWGFEEIFIDMLDRPELVHKGMRRVLDGLLARLDKYEEFGLLDYANGNYRVGSGGLGITDELPASDFGGGCSTRGIWGTSATQIFSEVSPAMHEEFALRYELEILDRFGLNCYGCCEPLDWKMGIVRKIPRLRRISMSPWVDIDRGAAEIGDDYVYSHKPNPALLAGEKFDAAAVRKEIRTTIEKTKGLNVEIIMKDVHTLRNEPERLFRWAAIAMEEVARC